MDRANGAGVKGAGVSGAMKPAKLLTQVIEYDKLAEILKGADEFIRPDDIGTEDIVEFERIDSLPESSSVSEKGT